MASFQIHQDKDNNKENFNVSIPAGARNAKQPLGLLNTNQINQRKTGKPSIEEVKIHKPLVKKSNELVPVIEQFQANSLPEGVVPCSSKSMDCSVTEVLGSDTEKGKDQVIQKPTRSSAYVEVQYQMDILANCREGECKNRPNPIYMIRQADISHRMRAMLIDWLVDVALDYEMNTETIYLAVSYIDRFLSKVAVKRSVLQLVGTTALFLASKFEEIEQPSVDELIYITDDSYTRKQILSMERLMLKILSYTLMTPTCYAFVKMYAVMCDDMSEILESLTMYISELSLLEGDRFLLYLPSKISSASLALARHILGMEMWSPQLEKITTYKLKDLKTVVLVLSSNHKSAAGLKLQAIQNKYKRKQFGKVAVIDDIQLTHDQFDKLCLAYELKHGTTI